MKPRQFPSVLPTREGYGEFDTQEDVWLYGGETRQDEEGDSEVSTYHKHWTAKMGQTNLPVSLG
jgi:hypothetical protein